MNKRLAAPESQRALVAARLANLPAHRPGKGSGPIGLSQPEAAKVLAISQRTVKRARRVLEEGSPALVRAVESGELAVSAAAQIAVLPQRSGLS